MHMKRTPKPAPTPRIIAIIPARGGSKGIPHKNIAFVGNKPLIFYSIREAHRSKLIDATIVSTDDMAIAETARSFGADVPFLRPKELSGDTSPDIEFLKHAVLWLEKERGWKPEIVLFLQPTSPSRTAEDIDAAIKLMLDTGCDSVRTVIEHEGFHPLKMLLLEDGTKDHVRPITSFITKLNRLAPGSDVPRQILPKAFQPVGLVYATKTKLIKKDKVWGADVRALVVSREKLTDIDNPEDLKTTEAVLKKFGLLE